MRPSSPAPGTRNARRCARRSTSGCARPTPSTRSSISTGRCATPTIRPACCRSTIAATTSTRATWATARWETRSICRCSTDPAPSCACRISPIGVYVNWGADQPQQEAGGWLDTPVTISLSPRRTGCRAGSVPVEAFAINERRVGMRHVKWAVVMLGFAAVALGVGAVQGQQLSGEYKIGVLEPLTGNLAAEGKRHLEGFEIMRDLINERFGGVMGKKLVFVTGDAVDPTAAASEATRLVTREGVKIVTGTFSSTLCGAASEAAARQNVIYWETSCVDPRLTRRGLKNVFRTEIDGTGFGWYNVEFIAKHLAHRLGKKPNELRIAYLSEDSSYGQSVTETARQRAKQEFGMQEVAAEYYTFTTNDLTPVILKLKNANPDILHHIARDQDAILFWRQAREQNFLVKAVVHAGATGYAATGFGKAFGNDANGPFALLEPGPGLIIEKMRPEGQRIERAFREAVKAKTGSDVLAGAHQLAGGGLWILKLALDAAKTDDLDKFRAAVLAMDLPVGSAVNGWGVKFDETGQNSNARVQHYMLQWQNGSLVTVWPEEFTTNRAKWIPLGAWDQRK